MKNTLKEFKDFINNGNIVELSVAFVMGVAFSAIINSVVTNLITPVVALFFSIFGIDGSSLSSMAFSINGVDFGYGAVISAAINFVIIAGALFMVIKAYNNFKKDGDEEAHIDTELSLLKEIRDNLHK